MVLHPQVEESLQIDQGDTPVLLAPRLTLGLRSEATSGDVDAHVLWPQDCHERPQPVSTGLLLPALHLHLDSRSRGTERIGERENVQASVWTGWRHPMDVVAHCL